MFAHDATPCIAVQMKDFLLPNGDWLRVTLGDICEDCMQQQPDTSVGEVRKVMHSLEYYRHKQAGEDMDGVIVNDCVPPHGVFDTTHPKFQEWVNRQIMVEVAKDIYKLAIKRGVDVEFLQIERKGKHMAWEGKGTP